MGKTFNNFFCTLIIKKLDITIYFKKCRGKNDKCRFLVENDIPNIFSGVWGRTKITKYLFAFCVWIFQTDDNGLKSIIMYA